MQISFFFFTKNQVIVILWKIPCLFIKMSSHFMKRIQNDFPLPKVALGAAFSYWDTSQSLIDIIRRYAGGHVRTDGLKRQTALTKVRLLLTKQSGQGLCCLLF